MKRKLNLNTNHIKNGSAIFKWIYWKFIEYKKKKKNISQIIYNKEFKLWSNFKFYKKKNIEKITKVLVWKEFFFIVLEQKT